MAKRKRFNIEDLYPKDYCFDYEEFEKDPWNYQFSEDDYAYSRAEELRRYEEEVPMTYYEKTLLRKWVMAGHSPCENPGSKYICLPDYPDMDFLDVYRMDREIRKDIKGMTKAQKMEYFKELEGWPENDASNLNDSLFADVDLTGHLPLS